MLDHCDRTRICLLVFTSGACHPCKVIIYACIKMSCVNYEPLLPVKSPAVQSVVNYTVLLAMVICQHTLMSAGSSRGKSIVVSINPVDVFI